MAYLDSNDDLVGMVKQARAESGQKMEAIYDDIFNRMSYMVYKNTKRYRIFPNYEDLKQEAFIALFKCIRTYNPDKYPNFFIYVSQATRRTVARAASKFDVVYSPTRSKVVYTDPGDMIDKKVIDTPEEIYFAKETSVQIDMALSKFSNRDGDIVKRIFGLGDYNPHTLREVGSKPNITHERVRQIKENVVSGLRKNRALRAHYIEE